MLINQMVSIILISLGLFLPQMKRETGSIEGVVRDVKGAPVPGATVYILDSSNIRHSLSRRIQVSTDSNGRFRFHSVSPGTIYVHAYKESDGYADAAFSFFVTNQKAWQTVTVEAGKVSRDVFIELGPKHAILKLLIRDERGNPILGAVTFVREDDPDRLLRRSSTLDETYFVPPVPFRIEVESKGYQKWKYNDGKRRSDSNLIKLKPEETLTVTAQLKKSR